MSSMYSKCELFKSIAEYVWDEICRNHSIGNRLSEEGLSRNTIVSRVLEDAVRNRTFNVFAQKARNEVNSGADIEIYVDSGDRRFYRLLLQSKLMELNGCFEKLNRDSGSTGRKQYDSLLQFANTVQAEPFYLMYNGCPGYTSKGNDCAGQYDEKQFGCAIIKAQDIKKHCESLTTGTLGSAKVSRPQGEPWRYLTCCDFDGSFSSRLYTLGEIDLDDNFKDIFTSPNIFRYITGDSLSNRMRVVSNNNQIHESGWNPSARIIISKEKMYKDHDELLKFV